MPQSALHRPITALTVLVVDDEADVRMACAEVLKDAGYTVLEASDGASGLRVLSSDTRIDLLISDIGMPGMNGKEVVDQARKSRPTLRVLYVTGYAAKSVFGDGNIDEDAQLLSKPIVIDDSIDKAHGMIPTLDRE